MLDKFLRITRKLFHRSFSISLSLFWYGTLEINVLEETCGKILINLYIDSRIHWKGISLHFRLIFSSKNVLLSAIKRIDMNCRKSRKFSLVWKREEKFSYCRGFDRKLFYFKLKKLRDGMFENYKYRETDCKLLKNLIPTFFFSK